MRVSRNDFDGIAVIFEHTVKKPRTRPLPNSFRPIKFKFSLGLRCQAVAATVQFIPPMGLPAQFREIL